MGTQPSLMVEKTIEKVKKTDEEKKIELDSKNAEKQALKAIAIATEKEIEIQETEKLIQENNEKEKELLQQELEKLKKQNAEKAKIEAENLKKVVEKQNEKKTVEKLNNN